MAASFTDMTGREWYAADVVELAANAGEIIKGYPDGSFRAAEKLTVDQFVTMLVRAGGQKAENHSEYWALNYLHRAKEMGILKDGDFADFRAEITREEMALLMLRFLEKREDLSKVDISQTEAAILDFVMVGAYKKPYEVQLEYQAAVKKAYVLGLLTGYEDTSFVPQGILTRAEAATAVIRLLKSERRAAFRPEEMKQKQEAALADHYYGGSKWIDPTEESIPKVIRVKEDRILTKGGLDYSPRVNIIIEDNNYPDSSVDDIRGSIEYNEKGVPEEHLKDLERLLLRRVLRAEAEKVMQYLRKKQGIDTHLDYPGTDIFLDNGRYLVRLEETIDLKGIGYYITFNIWYMDAKWQELYTKYYDYKSYHKIR